MIGIPPSFLIKKILCFIGIRFSILCGCTDWQAGSHLDLLLSVNCRPWGEWRVTEELMAPGPISGEVSVLQSGTISCDHVELTCLFFFSHPVIETVHLSSSSPHSSFCFSRTILVDGNRSLTQSWAKKRNWKKKKKKTYTIRQWGLTLLAGWPRTFYERWRVSFFNSHAFGTNQFSLLISAIISP